MTEPVATKPEPVVTTRHLAAVAEQRDITVSHLHARLDDLVCNMVRLIGENEALQARVKELEND